MSTWRQLFASFRRRSTRAALLGLAFLGVLVVLVLHARRFDFINDDAFISFRYAENLVRHGQLVFNLGEPVEGYTNFLWTLLMALVIRLGGDPVTWSKGLGILFSAGTLSLLFLFGLRVSSSTSDESASANTPRLSAWSLLAPLLLALSASFACWTEGGLETALFTFLLTAAVLIYLDEEFLDRRIPVSACFLALAALTRPEGLLVFAGLGLHMLLSDWIAQRRFLPRPRRWLFAGLFLLIYLPYWFWRFDYYGHAFPNTYYLKGAETSWSAGLDYFATFLRQNPAWLALFAIAVPFGTRRWRNLLLGVIGIVVIPFTVHVVRVGGDFMALHRFFVPLLPLLYLMVQEGAGGVARLVTQAATSGRRPTRAAYLVLVASLGLYIFHNARVEERAMLPESRDGIDSIGWCKTAAVQWSAIGRYLRRTYPEDTTLVTTAAGAIPYYSRMRTLDALGLNDEYIAHEVTTSDDRPGHRKRAPQSYVDRWDPDLIINHPVISREARQVNAAQRRQLEGRGLVMESVRVPGMDPPYWNFVRKQSLHATPDSRERR